MRLEQGVSREHFVAALTAQGDFEAVLPHGPVGEVGDARIHHVDRLEEFTAPDHLGYGVRHGDVVEVLDHMRYAHLGAVAFRHLDVGRAFVPHGERRHRRMEAPGRLQHGRTVDPSAEQHRDRQVGVGLLAYGGVEQIPVTGHGVPVRAAGRLRTQVEVSYGLSAVDRVRAGRDLIDVIRLAEQALLLGGEVVNRVPHRVVQRLDTDVITRREKRPRTPVVQHEGVHPVEPADERLPPLQIGVDQDLGVGSRTELATQPFQLVPQ